MARAPWLIDSRRFATKIKNPTFDPLKEDQNGGPVRKCPNCNYEIDNSDVAQEWPGLPAGVKFDPSDQELMGHLAAKVGVGNSKSHPLIDEFIPTLKEDDGICYSHPENLPGVKQDGSVCHFFHRTAKAYHTGNRKRRKIQEDRWHKTGKTRPVNENGIQRGWKKILVLYMSTGKGKMFEKTNWVMHQYHFGSEEDENDGEFVVSKIFYQQQHKQLDKNEVPQETEVMSVIPIPDPLTPVTSTPEPSCYAKSQADLDAAKEEQLNCIDSPGQVAGFRVATFEGNASTNNLTYQAVNDQANYDSLQGVSDHTNVNLDNSTWQGLTCRANISLDDSSLLPKESQLKVDSQQLLDDFLFCAETVQNPPSQNLILDPVEYGRIKAKELDKAVNASDAIPCLDNIELDTPPDIENIELNFNSQESLSAWTRDKTH